MSFEHDQAKQHAVAPLQRRADRRAGPAVGPATAPASGPSTDRAAVVRNVQRIAGNQGLIRLLEHRQPAPVQRMTTTADLDKVMGGSNTRGAFGKGASSYALLRKALAKYEAAKGKAAPEVVKLLELVGTQCMDWLNTHKGDSPRHTLVRALMDEVGAESLALSKKAAEARYLESMYAYKPAADAQHWGLDLPGRADTPHRFQVGVGDLGVSSASDYAYDVERSRRMDTPEGHEEKLESLKARREFRDKYKISAAEDAAIRAYTDTAGGAFTITTAASANDRGWIEAMQKKLYSKVSASTLREEGALHAAVATQGIMKLPRYRKVSYRGESVTQKDFDALKVGAPHTFKALTSTSKRQGKAEGFAVSNMNPDRPIGLLWVMTDVGGRDVELLSQGGGGAEAEVLLPPSTKVVIATIRLEREENFTSAKGKGPIYRIETVPGGDGPATRPPSVPQLPQAPLKTRGRGPMPGLPTPPGG